MLVKKQQKAFSFINISFNYITFAKKETLNLFQTLRFNVKKKIPLCFTEFKEDLEFLWLDTKFPHFSLTSKKKRKFFPDQATLQNLMSLQT